MNLFSIIIPVPSFPGVADGKRNVAGAFRFTVKGGAFKYVFDGLLAVAAKPEPQALAEVKIFPAFVLPVVALIVHALQFRVGFKGFL